MKSVCRNLWILISVLALAMVGPLQAQVPPEKLAEVSAKAFRHTDLRIPTMHQSVGLMPAESGEQALERLGRLGVNAATARIDRRSGRFSTLLPSTPLLPGTGVGNKLERSSQQLSPWQAFEGYLAANKDALRIDLGELSSAYRVTSHGDGDLYQIFAPRVFDGISVRDSYISAVIGQGNLTLLGMHKWGDRGPIARGRRISPEDAVFAAEGYLSPLEVIRQWGKPSLVYLPMANDRGVEKAGLGQGYLYRLAWSVKVQVGGDGGHWEALVDAYTSELLAFEDQNQYAEAKGGVYPVSNDQIDPDGVAQDWWPMPYLDVITESGTLTTDTGGNLAAIGRLTAALEGPYIQMIDECGEISLTQNDDLNFGTSRRSDCQTPGKGGAGNTNASRTGFYELNKIVEMAQGQLPANSWLQQQLTSNMNIDSACNAFFSSYSNSVNFYRSGKGCANTGEIAGIFDHEWGHGLDYNDANPSISKPSGEGIADLYAALRLNDSCIGRNFYKDAVCEGYGDACKTCTGVRDIDYWNHDSRSSS